jgi:hypothetical protein
MTNISFVSMQQSLEDIEDIAIFLKCLKEYSKTFKCHFEYPTPDTCDLIDALALAHENRR